MIEVWKPIPGYKGYYEASNLGRIKSIERVIMSRLGYRRTIKARVLRQSINSRGYKVVSLCKQGHKRTRKVHHLVVETFLRPARYDESVHHSDLNKQNNKLTNLEIMTHEDHMRIHGLDIKPWEI